MTHKKAMKLKEGDNVIVQAPHYTGKMRLTEKPMATYGSDTVLLFGIGAGGRRLGCVHTYASFGKMKMKISMGETS